MAYLVVEVIRRFSSPAQLSTTLSPDADGLASETGLTITNLWPSGLAS